jgi:N-(5-amino-5-carboxypentanoyl)-L-cysteinyl-D-valine synthase
MKYSKNKHNLIPLLMDKTKMTIVSILAVWKSGAAIVPIDVNYPIERIAFMLEDTKATLVITNSKYVDKLKNSSSKIDYIEIDDIFQSKFFTQNHIKENLNPIARPHNVIYVIFTSGTTGKPKGVPIEHGAVVNFIQHLTTEYGMESRDDYQERVAMFSPYVFGPCIRQMLMALLNAHVLVVVRDEIKQNLNLFNSFLVNNEITYLNGTASVLQNYSYANAKHLKRLIFAGEELTEMVFNKIRRDESNLYKGAIIIEYGPTEASNVTSMKMFEPNEKRSTRSIGNMISNKRCYVLDKNMKLLPIGAIGELYIGGFV